MRSIIEWLAKIEKSATVFYQRLSEITLNKKLSVFLVELSLDEEEHCSYMTAGWSLLNEKNIEMKADIIVDDITKNKIENLTILPENLSSAITDEDIYNRIITIEFSEWNDIFLYVTGSLKEISIEYQHAASKIQEHINKIKKFFLSNKLDEKFINKIKSFETIWETRILIVDDTESITGFLKLFCSKIGSVDVAYNGKEALEKSENNYYDLVISDVDMPVCNGIEFYKRLNQKDRGLNEKFIFMSGNDEDSFIQQNSINFIKKPFTVFDMATLINSILSNNYRRL